MKHHYKIILYKTSPHVRLQKNKPQEYENKHDNMKIEIKIFGCWIKMVFDKTEN